MASAARLLPLPACAERGRHLLVGQVFRKIAGGFVTVGQVECCQNSKRLASTKWQSACSQDERNPTKFGQMLRLSMVLKRQYAQSPWIWPLGKIDQPKKADLTAPAPTSLVVSDLDAQSVTCLERLHDATSASEVMDILQGGGHDLMAVHYGRALYRLADIHQEYMQSQEPGIMRRTTAPILYESRFKDLCHIILQQSRHFDHDLFLEVMQALHRLKVPLKSSMMYTFLAQAEQRINDFSATELARFAGILSRLDGSDPRVSALMSGVGILAPRHISALRSLPHVLMLINTVGESLDRTSRAKLANLLLAILATDEERTLQHIVQAVLGLQKINFKLDILLELACRDLEENIQELPIFDLHSFLCALGGLDYPNHDFFQAASVRILEEIDRWQVTQLIDVLEACCRVNIQMPLLADRVIRRVVQENVQDIQLADFCSLTRTLADWNHKPPSSWNFEAFTTQACDAMLRDQSKLSAEDCRPVLTLALSLASMGCYPTILLELVASRKFANWVMMVKDERKYKNTLRKVARLVAQLEDCNETPDRWTESLKKVIPVQ